MDVVFRAVNSVEKTVSILNYAPNVFVKFFVMFFRKCSLSVISAEYDVIEDLSEAVHSVVI